MVESINNLNNFVLGNDFNEDTIYTDINNVFLLLGNNIHFELLDELRSNIVKYLIKYSTDSVNFIEFARNYSYLIEKPIIYELLEKEKLPFTHSKNSMVDQYLLSKICNTENINLSSAIYYLASNYDKRYAEDADLFMDLYYYLTPNFMDFGFIGNAPKMGTVEPYNESDEEIVNNMNLIRNNKSVKNHNRVVSHYAEYVAYNFLKNKVRDDQRLIWVSREIGDGFGYDLAILDNDYSRASLYEVKGLYNRDYGNITDNEFKLFNMCNECDYLEYHYIIVMTKDDDNLLDIYKDNRNILHYELYGNINYITGFDKDEQKILVRRK